MYIIYSWKMTYTVGKVYSGTTVQLGVLRRGTIWILWFIGIVCTTTPNFLEYIKQLIQRKNKSIELKE